MAKKKKKKTSSTAGKAGSYLTRKKNKTNQLDKAFDHMKPKPAKRKPTKKK